ncbi:MAG: hypothetical protein IPL49_02300 [Saprospirales bacterium]|nr:hypothetical protein [Saprospirales bacterium]
MFKHILAGADINWMAIFALVTFFALFAIALVAIFASDKKYIQRMAHLPLDDDAPEDTQE